MTQRTRITYTIEPRTDGYLANVYLDNHRVAKKQLPTEAESRAWVEEKKAELKQEVRE